MFESPYTPWFLVAIIVVLFYLTRRTPPTVRMAYEAISAEPLSIAEDLGSYEAGDEFLPEARLENSKISLLYFRTESPGETAGRVAETIDFILPRASGGIRATFIDGKLVAWTRNRVSTTGGQLSVRDHYLLQQVLQTVRETLGKTSP